MGIISSAFTGGQWKSWDENGWLEDNSSIERVKFRWANAPSNANILYQVKYWDNTANNYIWTPARFGEDEAGKPGTEIYGLHFMLTGNQNPQAQVFIVIKTQWGWNVTRPSLIESVNPIIGLQVFIGQQ
jgi:hypothetical protein